MPDNFALVPRSAAVQVGTDVDEEEVARKNVREEIVNIYESYAELYPNPGLAQEYAERDRLLAVYHAAHQQQLEEQSTREDSSSKKGILGFLWGKKRVGQSAAAVQEQPVPSASLSEKDILVYSDPVLTKDNEGLCGTASALETSCIPPEAHAVARFHLVSHKTRGDRPNAVRGSPGLVIVGLGVIAEAPPENTDEPFIRHTSDREDLLSYKAFLDGTIHHDVSYARGTCVGSNCLAISWGFPDGIVCVYRRIDLSDSKADSMVGWECIGMIPPSKAVLDNMHDLFAHQEPGEMPSSGLLCVADVVPLMVDAPGDSGAVATLTIARLGAFIELVPLLSNVWEGPVLTSTNHRSPRRKRKRRSDLKEHYCLGKVPSLLDAAQDLAAMTTSQHHSDIMCLEVLRTSVGGDTEWDEQSFPHAPPAEYVLAACGTQEGSGEVVTFWGLSIVFHSADDPDQYSPHVSYLDGIQLGSIGDMTVFASDKIFGHWRRARHVELRSREGENQFDRKIGTDEENLEKHASPMSTVSLPAPVARLRFSSGAESPSNPVLLAVSGADGIVTCLKCTEVVRFAVHGVAKEIYEKMYESEDQEAAPISVVFERSIIGASHFVHGEQVVDIGWLRSSSGPSILNVLLAIKESGRLVTLAIGLAGNKNTFPGCLGKGLKGHHLTVIGTDGEGRLAVALYGHFKRKHRTLRFLELDRLDLGDILVNLSQSGRCERAISLADMVGAKGDDKTLAIIEECHKELWEKDANVRSLASVSDVSFTTNELLKIFGSQAQRDLHQDISLEDLLDVARKVLKRLKNTRLASALQVGGLDGANKAQTELRSNFLKLSTYILLCRVFERPPTLLNFREAFLADSLEKVASAFASMGDIPVLTLLWYRHRPALVSFWLKVLSNIPLSLDPRGFCHLVPVWKATGNGHCYFFSGLDNKRFQSWSELPVFLHDAYGMDSSINPADELLINQQESSFSWAEYNSQRSSLARWLVNRAESVDRTTANLAFVASFCDCALECLDLSAASVLQEMRELESIRITAIGLEHALSCGEGPSIRQSPAAIQVQAYQVRRMAMVDALALLLGEPGEPMGMLSRFKDSVLPILNVQGRLPALDEAIVTYCVRLVGQTSMPDWTSQANQDLVERIRNSLSFCVSLANASKPSIQAPKRLIKEASHLEAFVLGVTEESYRTCHKLSMLSSDWRFMIGLLWDLYECLPIRSDAGLDHLYQCLVAIDILTSWAATDLPPSIFEQSCVDSIGAQVVSKVCHAFCLELSVGTHSVSSEDKLRLLGAFLSDVEQLLSCSFGKAPTLASVFEEDLVKPLLQRGHFVMVGELSKRMLESWIEKQRLESLVVAYMNECMFSEAEWSSSGKDRVLSAIQCQDALLPFFPGLKTDFSSMRRYLDAAHFVNSVLHQTDESLGIHPAEIREKHPIDVIESVLLSNPSCILEGCPEWNDPDFACRSNHAIYAQYESLENPEAMVSPQKRSLPPLPGAAVLHLGSMLGMSEENATIAIKARIVHHLMSLGNFGAAAAVCLTLIYEKGVMFEREEVAILVIKTIAALLAADVYGDSLTKVRICRGVLKRSQGAVFTIELACIEDVLCVFPILESHTSMARPLAGLPIQEEPRNLESGPATNSPQQTPESEFFVFRAAGMVARRMSTRPPGASHSARLVGQHLQPPFAKISAAHVYQSILSDYSTDVHGLFLILQSKSAATELDNPLLLALGRLIAFWAISDAVHLRHGHLAFSYERSVAREYMGLAASLLLQLPPEDLTPAIGELQGIVADQIPAAIERTSELVQPSFLSPNPELVMRLVGRGYTENGARRSAVMSGNESFEAAVAWAVSHTLDPGFDDPMLFVASPDGSPLGSLSLDQTFIKLLQQTLESMRRSAGGEVQLENVSPTRPAKRQVVKAALKQKKTEKLTGRLPKVSVADPQTQQTDSTNCVTMGAQTTPSPVCKAPVAPATANPRLTTVASRAATATRSITSLPRTEILPRAVLPEDRPTLRQQGEAARKKSKSAGNIMDREERKRLIEQGRKLLEQNRANKREAAQIQPRYPLRSRTADRSATLPRVSATRSQPSVSKESVEGVKEVENGEEGWDFDDF